MYLIIKIKVGKRPHKTTSYSYILICILANAPSTSQGQTNQSDTSAATNMVFKKPQSQ